MQIYQGVCVGFVFSALMEYALVNYALRAKGGRKRKMSEVNQRDFTSQWKWNVSGSWGWEPSPFVGGNSGRFRKKTLIVKIGSRGDWRPVCALEPFRWQPGFTKKRSKSSQQWPGGDRARIIRTQPLVQQPSSVAQEILLPRIWRSVAGGWGGEELGGWSWKEEWLGSSVLQPSQWQSPFCRPSPNKWGEHSYGETLVQFKKWQPKENLWKLI